MPEDTYGQPWSRQYRGLLVFLLDQSASMKEERQIGGKIYTNGQMATATLNELIYTIMKKTTYDPNTRLLKDYCDILVLGYGHQVVPLVYTGNGLPISISELNQHPKGYSMVLGERFDRTLNKVVQVKEKRPFWVVEESEGRYTEMALVLQEAYRGIQSWLKTNPSHRDSFPPIVINITDGVHNGVGNPGVEADKIRKLYTNDGYVLLFNCHLTSYGQQHIVFPKSEQEVMIQITNADERKGAIQLFQISSIIPRSMVQNAQISNVGLEFGARGFLYNASPSDLMNFLTWGTRQ